MSAPDSRAPDAALRQRVRKALDLAGVTDSVAWLDRVTNRVMAALTTDAPKEERRRVELDGGWWATYRNGHFHVCDTASKHLFVSAAEVAAAYIDDKERHDAKHAELIALKSEEVKPWGWVNVYEADPCIIRWNSEAEAKEAAVRGAKYVTRPLYEHPPAAAPAPQSETREIVGHAVIRENGSVVKAWFLNGNDAHRASHRSDALELTRRSGNADCTVVELLRGDDVPLVRQSPAGQP